VLLVEDEPGVRTLARHILAGCGYTVLEAADADSAYARAAAAEGVLDLVVTDVMMPGEHGPALAARLRAEWPWLKVLFVTGHADRELLDAVPAAAVLDKPFTQEALAARLLGLLGRGCAA
jgi:CheY-like chemotaxis protein